MFDDDPEQQAEPAADQPLVPPVPVRAVPLVLAPSAIPDDQPLRLPERPAPEPAREPLVSLARR